MQCTTAGCSFPLDARKRPHDRGSAPRPRKRRLTGGTLGVMMLSVLILLFFLYRWGEPAMPPSLCCRRVCARGRGPARFNWRAVGGLHEGWAPERRQIMLFGHMLWVGCPPHSSTLLC